MRSQIREVLQVLNLRTFDKLQLSIWNAFYLVFQKFLINKAMDYQNDIKNLLKCYLAMQHQVSLKFYFLDSQLDFLPKNLGTVLDEHGKHFNRALVLWRKSNKVSGHYASQLLLDTILQSNGSGPMSEIHVKAFVTLLYCNSMYQVYQFILFQHNILKFDSFVLYKIVYIICQRCLLFTGSLILVQRYEHRHQYQLKNWYVLHKIRVKV